MMAVTSVFFRPIEDIIPCPYISQYQALTPSGMMILLSDGLISPRITVALWLSHARLLVLIFPLAFVVNGSIMSFSVSGIIKIG
jgi:hypothetical protein